MSVLNWSLRPMRYYTSKISLTTLTSLLYQDLKPNISVWKFLLNMFIITTLLWKPYVKRRAQLQRSLVYVSQEAIHTQYTKMVCALRFSFIIAWLFQFTMQIVCLEQKSVWKDVSCNSTNNSPYARSCLRLTLTFVCCSAMRVVPLEKDTGLLLDWDVLCIQPGY